MMRGSASDRGGAVAAAVVHDHDRPASTWVSTVRAMPFAVAPGPSHAGRRTTAPAGRAGSTRSRPPGPPAPARRPKQGRVDVFGGQLAPGCGRSGSARRAGAARRTAAPAGVSTSDPRPGCRVGRARRRSAGGSARPGRRRRRTSPGVHPPQDREHAEGLNRPRAVVEREGDRARHLRRSGGPEAADATLCEMCPARSRPRRACAERVLRVGRVAARDGYRAWSPARCGRARPEPEPVAVAQGPRRRLRRAVHEHPAGVDAGARA